jgi:hypothetical protein
MKNETKKPTAAQARIMELRHQLKISKTTLRVCLVLSLVANALSAQPTPLGYAVAATPPILLFAALELVARVKIGGSLGQVLWTLTVVLAALVARTSYGHMHEVVLMAGESEETAATLPLVVDGLAALAQIMVLQLDKMISQPVKRKAVKRPARKLASVAAIG